MPNYLRILPILLLLWGSTAAQGILFFEGSWSDALTKARLENKMIFLDAYTTWCAPCKKMEKEVFPDAKLSQVFNDRYISIRMDMEKGEGIELAKDFGIEAYPTLIFADTDGKVLHRDAGYKSADQLLELADIAMDDSRRLASWKERFDSGERDTAFLYRYTMLLKSIYDRSYATVAAAYLARQQDWLSPANMDFIFQTSEIADSEIFRFLVEHRLEFETKMGKDKITTHIDAVAQNYLTDIKSGVTIEAARAMLRLVYPENAERLSAAYPMTYYRQRGDRENYAQAAVDYFENYQDDAGELSEAALTFSKVITDTKLLKSALKWAKKANKLEKSTENDQLIILLKQKIKGQ